MIRIAVLAALCLSLAFCSLLAGLQAPGGAASPSAAGSQPSGTILPSASAPSANRAKPGTPAAQPELVLPPLAPTSTPTPIPIPQSQSDLERLRQALVQRIGSPEWTRLGLPKDLNAHAQSFVDSAEALPAADAQDLASILAQWQTLEDLAQRKLVPSQDAPVVQVYFYTGVPAGQSTPVVYARSGPPEVAAGSQAIFMPFYALGGDGAPQGLVLAPVFSGLVQRIGPDGRYVEYRDAQDRLVLAADGRIVDDQTAQGKTLLEMLNGLYDANSPYQQASVYPRFVFPVDQVQAGFYGLDRSLSTLQVTLLNETFHVFDRPALAPLKQIMFGPNVAVVVKDKLKDAAGLNYSGTGVIVLDRRDLFSNKYQLAQVLAHEASHVLQGDLQNGNECAQLLQREVGDKTIPADFYSWDALRLIQGIQNQKIGAYHTSLWILTRLGIRDTAWLVSVIHSGTANGKSLLIDCNP